MERAANDRLVCVLLKANIRWPVVAIAALGGILATGIFNTTQKCVTDRQACPNFPERLLIHGQAVC